jgi:1-deoxy-D-xylulose-5-phosphate synthase
VTYRCGVGLLETIASPADVRRLRPEQCMQLAAECRDFLVDAVSRTGGHLGPSLGAVELIIGIHRVFDSPRDKVLFDTGHQAYVHKMLTGRQHRFPTLRQPGGLSGYPSRAESEHDVIENSHASTALSYADGLARAWSLRGERDRSVLALVGDGALTGGMCWEALNNIAAGKDRSVVVLVNDNGRSYGPTIGGLADHLATLRTAPAYERTLDVARGLLTRVPLVGHPVFEALHGAKRGIKDLVQPQVMFEDLGIKYVGPVDGHDVAAVESALRRARRFGGPVIVHCVTRKGFGYRPAEADDADCMHGPGAFHPGSGKAVSVSTDPTWTSVLGEEMLALGAEDPTVVAVTAAMLLPVGLGPFAAAWPERVIDVGIAEQHAVTSATGLAMGGMKPVVCLYATFLNRAFDQVLMDAALHRQPVTIVLDRAGVTGTDGPSHNGMWDLSFLQLVPGIAVAAPRDGATLRASLRQAVRRQDGPSVVRFPKGAVGPDLPALERVGGVDVLARGTAQDVLLVSVGALATVALDVAGRAADQGIGVTVVDPRWVVPVDPALVSLARAHALVVVIEDGTRIGGVGARLAQVLADAGVEVPVRSHGLPGGFLAQGTRDGLLREAGLGAQELARSVVEGVTRLRARADDEPLGVPRA